MMNGWGTEHWWRRPLVEVSARRYFWPVRPTTIVITALSGAAIIWAMLLIEPITSSDDADALTITGYTARFTMVVAPLILGLVWAPAPKPKEFSETAAIAVDNLSEMRRASIALADDISERLIDDSDNANKSLHFRIIQELNSQRGQIEREISRWARVSPGVEDEIVKGRKTHAAILRKLEGELDVDEKTER